MDLDLQSIGIYDEFLAFVLGEILEFCHVVIMISGAPAPGTDAILAEADNAPNDCRLIVGILRGVVS